MSEIMISRKLSTLLCIVLLTGITIGQASADVMQTGTVIQTDFGDNSASFVIGNTFDQSGLEQPYQSGLTDFDSYVASTGVTGVADGNSWFSENSPTLPGDIVFDLGSSLLVSKLAIWSFPSSDVNVLDQFEVRVSNDPAFATSALVGSFTFINLLNGAMVDPRPAQVFDLTVSVGRFVKLTLTAANTSLVGAGEFAFGVSDGAGDDDFFVIPIVGPNGTTVVVVPL